MPKLFSRQQSFVGFFMSKRGKGPIHQELLEAKLSELTALIKELSPDARVEIAAERHEDEDAAIDVYVPQDPKPQQLLILNVR